MEQPMIYVKNLGGNLFRVRSATLIHDVDHTFIADGIGVAVAKERMAVADRRHADAFQRHIDDLGRRIREDGRPVVVVDAADFELSDDGYVYVYDSVAQLRQRTNDEAIYLQLEMPKEEGTKFIVHVELFLKQIGYALALPEEDDMDRLRIANLVLIPDPTHKGQFYQAESMYDGSRCFDHMVTDFLVGVDEVDGNGSTGMMSRIVDGIGKLFGRK